METDDQQLAEYEDAEGYDLENGVSGPDLRYYLDLAREVGGPGLDLACGTGFLTIPFATLGLTMTGADRAPKMLDLARRKALDLPIRWLHADCRTLDLDERFRLVTLAGNGFQEFLTRQDQEGILGAARRHLAPDGFAHEPSDVPRHGQMVALALDPLRLARPVAPALGLPDPPLLTLPLLEVRIGPEALPHTVPLLASLQELALGQLGLLCRLLGGEDALQGLAQLAPALPATLQQLGAALVLPLGQLPALALLAPGPVLLEGASRSALVGVVRLATRDVGVPALDTGLDGLRDSAGHKLTLRRGLVGSEPFLQPGQAGTAVGAAGLDPHLAHHTVAPLPVFS